MLQQIYSFFIYFYWGLPQAKALRHQKIIEGPELKIRGYFIRKYNIILRKYVQHSGAQTSAENFDEVSYKTGKSTAAAGTI